MAIWQWAGGAVLILALGGPSAAAADPINPTAIDVVKGIKANDGASKMYVVGVVEGVWAANNAVRVNSHDAVKIYCPPEDLEITAEQAGNILEHYIEAHTSTRNLSGGAELSYALIELFPCH